MLVGDSESSKEVIIEYVSQSECKSGSIELSLEIVPHHHAAELILIESA